MRGGGKCELYGGGKIDDEGKRKLRGGWKGELYGGGKIDDEGKR